MSCIVCSVETLHAHLHVGLHVSVHVLCMMYMYVLE